MLRYFFFKNLTKFQLRNQVQVLKNALLEEKAKTTKLDEDLATKDMKLRKLNAENESLSFRNEQLIKRVETLQNTITANNAAFTNAKNKKV